MGIIVRVINKERLRGVRYVISLVIFFFIITEILQRLKVDVPLMSSVNYDKSRVCLFVCFSLILED